MFYRDLPVPAGRRADVPARRPEKLRSAALKEDSPWAGSTSAWSWPVSWP
ncbi:MAG: hypothetical protein MZV64_12700 [Ignavibacteriales bacterium]|nr:hypothetical protein [Ignavibacteriales bacterium]